MGADFHMAFNNHTPNTPALQPFGQMGPSVWRRRSRFLFGTIGKINYNGKMVETETTKPLWQRATGIQLALLALMLFGIVVLSAGMGYIDIAFVDVARIIGAALPGQEGLARDLDPLWSVVVMDVRLPRILTAAIVGGGLAFSGAVFQGILLNPLADPYTLGVSAGAAFGAAVALLLNLTLMGASAVPLFAFAGATATLVLVIYLSSAGGGVSSNNLILSGIIVAAILSAGLSFIKYLADEQVAVIIFWLMGSFVSRTWTDVSLTVTLVGFGFLVTMFYSRDLNLLSLGERTAVSLGVNSRRVSLVMLITASMVAAACVSVSGIIGFVGLLVPHMVRGVTGPDNRRLIPVSLLAGALLLLCADTVTRALLPSEIPIGVLTALIGGPFFCYIFRKRQLMGRGA
jgi:cobalamin transport system permease protein